MAMALDMLMAFATAQVKVKMKSIIIKDGEGKTLIHILRLKTKNGYDIKVLKDLCDLEIKIINDDNKQVVSKFFKKGNL